MTEDIAIAPESETTASLSVIGSEGTHEFIRYFLASAVALVVDMGSLWFLTSVVGISYLVSGAIAFGFGLIVVYILSVYWVFAARVMRNKILEFGLFSLIGFIGLLINEAVLYILTGVFGVFYLVSKIASVILVFSWNFGARKWLLFRSRS